MAPLTEVAGGHKPKKKMIRRYAQARTLIVTLSIPGTRHGPHVSSLSASCPPAFISLNSREGRSLIAPVQRRHKNNAQVTKYEAYRLHNDREMTSLNAIGEPTEISPSKTEKAVVSTTEMTGIEVLLSTCALMSSGLFEWASVMAYLRNRPPAGDPSVTCESP